MNISIDADYLAAERYDQYYGTYGALPAWFLAHLSSCREVLELACGTGRIAIPLAESGIKVTGVDYSEPMLTLAMQKATERRVSTEWLLADIRRFDTGKRYQAILLLNNALWHLHTLLDFEDCLQCVRRHLTPDGLFVLHAFVPGLDILNRDPDMRHPFSEYIDADSGEKVTVSESYKYEADTQIARVIHYKNDSDEIVGGLNLRMYFPEELAALLKYNGMTITDRFGNWDRDAFGPESKHQIYLCSAMKSG